MYSHCRRINPIARIGLARICLTLSKVALAHVLRSTASESPACRVLCHRTRHSLSQMRHPRTRRFVIVSIRAWRLPCSARGFLGKPLTKLWYKYTTKSRLATRRLWGRDLPLARISDFFRLRALRCFPKLPMTSKCPKWGIKPSETLLSSHIRKLHVHWTDKGVGKTSHCIVNTCQPVRLFWFSMAPNQMRRPLN